MRLRTKRGKERHGLAVENGTTWKEELRSWPPLENNREKWKEPCARTHLWGWNRLVRSDHQDNHTRHWHHRNGARGHRHRDGRSLRHTSPGSTLQKELHTLASNAALFRTKESQKISQITHCRLTHVVSKENRPSADSYDMTCYWGPLKNFRKCSSILEFTCRK